MNIREKLRGAMRRAGDVSVRLSAGLFAGRGVRGKGMGQSPVSTGDLFAGSRAPRRTAGTGSNLAPFSFADFPAPMVPTAGRRAGMPAAQALPKATPVNLRRLAETPVARRAINVIKDRIAGMRWRIQPRSGRVLEQLPDGAERIRILTDNFEAPNPDDSFRSLLEQVLEDVIVGGFGAIEIGLGSQAPAIRGQEVVSSPFSVLGEGSTQSAAPITQSDGDRRQAASTLSTTDLQEMPSVQAELGRTGVSALHGPLVLWPVDGATIRILPDWDGRPDSPRYVQVTGLYGPNSQIVLNDDELSYIRLNPRTHTPFGLGRVEVAFETINTFLNAHRYAGRLASNSVVQYALWMQGLTPANHERLIRWWQDEIEGTGRVPIMSVETKPEVLRFGAGTDADLRLAWQEFLIRVIADAFDLPAQFLGVTSDVNRATAAEMTEMAFRSAIVPTARLLAEHLTRDVIGKKLGWTDLEFVFIDVDATDEMEQAQIDEILLRNGIVTVEEVRRQRGLGNVVG